MYTYTRTHTYVYVLLMYSNLCHNFPKVGRPTLFSRVLLLQILTDTLLQKFFLCVCISDCYPKKTLCSGSKDRLCLKFCDSCWKIGTIFLKILHTHTHDRAKISCFSLHFFECQQIGAFSCYWPSFFLFVKCLFIIY